VRMIWLLVPPLIFPGGCRDHGPGVQSSPAVFQVDLQTQFSDDSVRVLIDSRCVFEGRVTTHLGQGLARSLSVDGQAGRHNVRVHVVHPFTGTEKDTTLVVTDTLTLAVNLDERSRTLYFALYPFLIPYR
jgi:hypothetical protein